MPNSIKFHRNAKGQWVPCQATKRACKYAATSPHATVTIPTQGAPKLAEITPVYPQPVTPDAEFPTLAWDSIRETLEAQQVNYKKELGSSRGDYGRTGDRTPFTMETLRQDLESRPQDAAVKIYEENVDLEVYSWRGDYSQAQLIPSYNRDTPVVTVADLVASLNWHTDKYMTGYKGGIYLIKNDTSLWAEFDTSSCEKAYISGTRYDLKPHTVHLLTAREESYDDLY